MPSSAPPAEPRESITPTGSALAALFVRMHASSSAEVWPISQPSAVQALQFRVATAGATVGSSPLAGSARKPTPPTQNDSTRGRTNPSAQSATPVTSLAAATALEAQMLKALNGGGTRGPLDRDVLRLRDLYHLKPKEKLVVGKYVPDPSGAPPPSKSGSARRGSATRGSTSTSSMNSASAVYGSASGAMLRLRRQSATSGAGDERQTTPRGTTRARASGGVGGGRVVASTEDCDDDNGSDSAGSQQGSDDDNGDGPQQRRSGGAGGTAVGSQRVGAKRRQATIGDISSSGDDEDNEDASRSATTGGAAGATARDAVVQIRDFATYKLLKSLYPFPISCDTLYFPVAYPPPTVKDLEDSRGAPRAINTELHGSPDDDIALHLAARGLTDASTTFGGPSVAPPLFTTISIQKGNLNKVPLYKIGPNAVAFKVVINAFESSGALYTPHSNWNILWAKRATPEVLARLGPYQKVNHFPGAWGVGRKDNLHKNVAKMRKLFGNDAFDIVPMGFICPQDEALLREDVARNTPLPTAQTPNPPLPTYICKPVASSCGKGISLSLGMPPMPSSNKSVIVQRYVGNPMLIDGRKFDLRIYCVITGFNPLRIYLFDQGLVRFAAERYPGPCADLESTYKHLTNYSVNKTAQLARESKGKSAESDEPVDIKWALSDFKKHLCELHGAEEGERLWRQIFAEMADVVTKAFLSIENEVNSRLRAECRDPTGRGCFEMYGLDLMLDDQLKVYLIEVNIMPSLATGTSLDKAVKSRMLAHMLTMVGVVPYARRDAAAAGDDQPRGTGISATKYFYPPPPGARKGPSSAAAEATVAAAAAAAGGQGVGGSSASASGGGGRHASQVFYNEPLLTNFDALTPAERLMLIEADEEYARRGGFTRIFPTPETPARYFGLFSEGVNRNNYLLASWVAAQGRKNQ